MKRLKLKGFTLVELLVVIAILAILTTVSVVGYTKFIEKARVSNDKALVSQLNTYFESYKINNPISIENKDDLYDFMKNRNDFANIVVQSKQDGYDIYFDTITKSFKLMKIEDAEKDKERFIVIDASGEKHETRAKIISALKEKGVI